MLLSLLTPLFGVAFGAALLGDPIELRFSLGALLVLTGVLIVNLRLILQRQGGVISKAYAQRTKTSL
jgi:drug/metabolite transporter (DMT)-like permease